MTKKIKLLFGIVVLLLLLLFLYLSLRAKQSTPSSDITSLPTITPFQTLVEEKTPFITLSRPHDWVMIAKSLGMSGQQYTVFNATTPRNILIPRLVINVFTPLGTQTVDTLVSPLEKVGYSKSTISLWGHDVVKLETIRPVTGMQRDVKKEVYVASGKAAIYSITSVYYTDDPTPVSQLTDILRSITFDQ